MVWIYVEGESDRLALNALWAEWRGRLRASGHGINIIPLDDKSRFFRKIGPRSAQILAGNPEDVVVGLPDFYPNSEYARTGRAHDTVGDLMRVQRELVRDGLATTQGVLGIAADRNLARFYPSALKHDMEMLLLAAVEALENVLGVKQGLHGWRKPVEDQNQLHPPKSIVEDLFRTKRGTAYRDTKDAPAVLRRVTNIQSILWTNGQLNCPVFKQMLDWVGARTGVPAYQ